ncbi:MAG: 2-hydroxyacid dehydrogenase [Bacteriovoracaceae bacterium]
MKKIYVSAPFYGEGNQILKQSGHTIVYGPGDLSTHLKDCHAIISYVHDKITDSLLEQAPQLKVVSNYAVGVDNIDLLSCKKRGIKVGNTPDVLTYATAELALTLMLNCGRQIKHAYTDVQRGNWKSWLPQGYLGLGLEDSTVGIIGMGRIGQSLAKMLSHGFGVNVIYHSRENKNISFAQHVSLEELLQKSDYVSLHMSSNEQTQSFINLEKLKMMKSSAYFINTARGDLVVEADLLTAINEAHIAGAGLDVTNPEPPTDNLIIKHPKIFLLPHIGSATLKAREKMGIIAAKNALMGLDNKALIHEVRDV